MAEPASAAPVSDARLEIRGARTNNLQGIDVDIPLGRLVGVCGPSGSGKSSLIIDTLARTVAPKKHTTSTAQENIEPGAHDRISGAPARCVVLEQSRAGIGSPAAFLGVRKVLETAYAASAEAVAAGLSDAFGERCASCSGRGVVVIDLGFLPDEHDECEACAGSGYRAEIATLAVRGLTLPALLRQTIEQVHERWQSEPKIARPLAAAVEVGLGYLTLQQPARTLSGGEVQRLRIALELLRGRGRSNDQRIAALYLLDEPTLGLHAQDVATLLGALRRLVAAGASVVLVEHDVQVLAGCDWLIECGPNGGPDGGQIVFQGSPQALAASVRDPGDNAETATSVTATAPFLRRALAGDA